MAQIAAMDCVDAQTAALIWLLMEHGASLTVAGPTAPVPGAGKSTTVKMLTGIIEPSEGQIFYNGRSVYDDFTAFQRRIGYVPEEPHLYPHLSGREYLQLVGRLRFDRGGVDDGLAHVSERVVHHVRERVHDCRLAFAR